MSDLSVQATMRARRNLAAWISEHGAQDSATCDLLDVLADLDKALDTAGVPRELVPENDGKAA